MRYTSILLFIAATTMVASGSVQDIRLSIKPLQQLFGGSQDVAVLLNITNIGNDLMGLLDVFKPFKEIMDPIFDVFCNGEKVNYVGAIAKRRAPLMEDFLQLAPGSSFTVPIKLSDVFNMTQACNYVVELRMAAREYLANLGIRMKGQVSMAEDVVLSSPPVAFFADSHRNEILEVGAAIAEGRYLTPTFTSCDTNRQNLLRTALGHAETLSSDSANYFTKTSPTTRYTTWYGTYSATNWGSLASKWNTIRDTIKSKTIAFNCACTAGTSSTYAYVYPSQPYIVYLCGQHWNSPMTGTDSQGGTIIHEVAHFTVVAGTNDYAYGQSSAKSLATSSPTKAMANSDSYQYFCENNPHQA